MPQCSVSELAQKPIANLLILHGLAEYAARYRSIARRFADRGISTFAIDQRGHAGQRPKTHVPRFDVFADDAIEAASRIRTESASVPLFFWGHSMGSMVAMLAAHRGPGVAGVVLTASSLDVFKFRLNPLNPFFRGLSSVAPRLRIPLALDPQKISREPAVQNQYAHDPLIARTASLRLLVEFARACSRVDELASSFRLPTLLIHGDADEVAPASGSQRLYERLGSSDKQQRRFPAARHEIHNDSEPDRSQLIDCISAWIAERAALSGSSAQ